MGEITLPRWVLTQICMPSGHRGPKKPVLLLPKVERWVPFSGGVLNIGDRHKDVYNPPEIPGVFLNWEYRFFAMCIAGKNSVITECRACGNLGDPDATVRKLHGSQGGCYKRLLAAYKLLIKDRRCIICDIRTDKRKWGTPICSSACCQAFCEVESQPKALLAALALVGDI